jgi:hypothetical protein
LIETPGGPLYFSLLRQVSNKKFHFLYQIQTLNCLAVFSILTTEFSFLITVPAA